MPPKRKNYTDQQVADALEAVKGGMSQHKAAKTYNIPRTTIRDRLSGKCNTRKILLKCAMMYI